MLHILVPTDFSELSKVAIRYALGMAKKLDGKVTLVHVIDTAEHASSMRLRFSSLLQELDRIAAEDFDHLVNELKAENKTGNPLKHFIEHGSLFVETVSNFAKRHRANLIVMGTHGASGLKKVFMGSNATSMLAASSKPVLVIPPKAKFKAVKSVVYATDAQNISQELKALLKILGKEKPVVHIIHVSPDRPTSLMVEEKIDKVVSKAGYRNAIVRVFVNKDPVPVITEYVDKIHVDMLAMFTHQYSFFTKMFKRSITKQITYLNNIPLLAFTSKKK